jgi:hypothetical protein
LISGMRNGKMGPFLGGIEFFGALLVLKLCMFSTCYAVICCNCDEKYHSMLVHSRNSRVLSLFTALQFGLWQQWRWSL